MPSENIHYPRTPDKLKSLVKEWRAQSETHRLRAIESDLTWEIASHKAAAHTIAKLASELEYELLSKSVALTKVNPATELMYELLNK